MIRAVSIRFATSFMGLGFLWIFGDIANIARATPTWEVVQLTNGANPDRTPAVSGTAVVWRRGSSSFGDIYKWSVGDPAPTRISVDPRETSPRISGQRVVWHSTQGGDGEVILWNDGVLTNLTNNSVEEYSPDVGGYAIVWQAAVSGLVYQDGQSSTPITANTGQRDEYPRVVDDAVVWEAKTTGSVDDYEIFWWKAGNVTRVTMDGFPDYLPDTDGETVVWYSASGPNGNTAIMRWRPGESIVQITPYSMRAAQPEVSGEVITFVAWDGTDYEIYFNYLGLTYQITDNSYDDFEPSIDGTRIAWEGHDSGGPHVFLATLALDGGSVSRACCEGLSCSLRTETDCVQAGGVWIPGATLCGTDTCPDAVRPADGWFTFQHDARRTGRSTAVIPNPPVRLWSVLKEDPSGFDPAVSPTVAPDGAVFVTSGSRMILVEPDGHLRWMTDTGISTLTSASFRNDGHFWIGGSKYRGADGVNFCAGGGQLLRSGTLDAQGNAYGSSPDLSSGNVVVKKTLIGCGVNWTYNGGTGPASPVALAPDGGVHVSGRFAHVKLDPSSGAVLWTYSPGGILGAPSVSPAGTVYLVESPNTLRALSSSGSVSWNLTLSGLQNLQGSPAPAIASDGTVYLFAKSLGNSRPTIVAVSRTGVEIWRHEESFSSGFDGLSPVVDGAGLVIFPVEGGDLVALSPVNGSVVWRIPIGGGDYANTSPAIGNDGTLYVTTNGGYLIAYGAGCAEPPRATPPFTYRRVVEEGQVIDGSTVADLVDLAVLPDGRVSFRAYVPETTTWGVFTESPGGGFEKLGRGSTIGGFTIEDVGMPTYAGDGTRYLPAYLSAFGSSVLVGDAVYAGTHTGADPAVLFDDLDWRYVDHDEGGRFLVWGRTAEDQATSLYSVDTASAGIARLVSVDDTIDGFRAASISVPPTAGYGDDGIAVFSATSTTAQKGILTQSSLVAQAGDTIGGHTLMQPDTPRRSAGGTIYYLSEGRLFRHALDGSDALLLGAGHSVSGQPIDAVLSHAANQDERIAFLASLVGADGVFLDSQPVAVSNVTEIDGVSVVRIGHEYPTVVSVNASGQVAFVVQRQSEAAALYVATLDYSFDANGDGFVDGLDFEAFVDCDQGGGGLSQCECLEAFDSSGNRTVDCVDWAAFQLAWTAGTEPPTYAACSGDVQNPPTVSGTDKCVGGANVGGDCTQSSDCPGGACQMKNRFVSAMLPATASAHGVKVNLVSLDTNSVATPGNYNGTDRWLGAPVLSVNDGVSPAFNVAKVQCAFSSQDWSTVGLVHAYGDVMVPLSSYDLSLCSSATGPCSSALRIGTAKWGDIIAPLGVTNFQDITSVVAKFQGSAAGPSKTRTKLAEPVNPGTAVNFQEISADVAAFQGRSYKQVFPTPPATCP